MVSKREFLEKNGLSKPGLKGRFSVAGAIAIKKEEEKGTVFSEYVPVTIGFEELEPPVRDLGEDIWGYTRGDFVFAFSSCRDCGRNINYCKCSHILAPSIVERLPAGSPAIVRRKR